MMYFFFFQAEDGIRDLTVTGVQTCALPIFVLVRGHARDEPACRLGPGALEHVARGRVADDVEDPLPELSERLLLSRIDLDADEGPARPEQLPRHVDRKSTRLNSSHSQISYAVFCLKQKKS